MSLNYKKISFRMGTALEVHCVEPWAYITGDYEIIGYTTIREMLLADLNFHEMHIENVDEDKKISSEKYYRDLYENDVPIYIMKHVDRNPYLLKDISKGIDAVDEYLYIADTMIDKNRTIVLVRRVLVNADIQVGTFDDKKFDRKMQEKLLNELGEVLDTYSDKHNVRDTFVQDLIGKTMVLQPKAEAEEEDKDFLDKQAAAAAAKKAAEEAERARLEAIALRERQLYEQEQILIKKRRQLNELIEQAENKVKEADDRLENIRRTEQALLLRELALAEKTAALNKRAQRINERETQLGLEHTDL